MIRLVSLSVPRRWPLAWLYHSAVNAICHRRLGSLRSDFRRSIVAADELQDLRDLLTDAMLHSAGLAIARDGEPELDPRIFLTATQRSVIRKVQEFGYRVKLRGAQ